MFAPVGERERNGLSVVVRGLVGISEMERFRAQPR